MKTTKKWIILISLVVFSAFGGGCAKEEEVLSMQWAKNAYYASYSKVASNQGTEPDRIYTFVVDYENLEDIFLLDRFCRRVHRRDDYWSIMKEHFKAMGINYVGGKDAPFLFFTYYSMLIQCEKESSDGQWEKQKQIGEKKSNSVKRVWAVREDNLWYVCMIENETVRELTEKEFLKVLNVVELFQPVEITDKATVFFFECLEAYAIAESYCGESPFCIPEGSFVLGKLLVHPKWGVLGILNEKMELKYIYNIILRAGERRVIRTSGYQRQKYKEQLISSHVKPGGEKESEK